MQVTTNAQKMILSRLMAVTPTNDFQERLDRTLEWNPVEMAMQAVYPATTGRPPSCAPLALFKMSLLQHGHGLSGLQDRELVNNPLTGRRFLG
jgi:hypothetical protein